MGSKAPKIPAPVPVNAPAKIEAPVIPPELAKLFGAGEQLLGQGAPLREGMLHDVLQAWMTGVIPGAMTPLATRRRGNIEAEGGRTREQMRARLESQGLLNSSYGNQVMGGVDRDISNMLVSSDTQELERLLNMAPALSQAGVGPGLGGMGSAAGELSRLSLGTSQVSAQNADNQLRAAMATAGMTNQVNQQNAMLGAQSSANKSQMLTQVGTAVGMAGAVVGAPFTGGLSLAAIPALAGGAGAMGSKSKGMTAGSGAEGGLV